MTAYPFDALRDIHLPPASTGVSPLWWGLTALLIGLVWVALWHQRRRRRLRSALHELACLERRYRHRGDLRELTDALSRLLRRYAMARFPNDTPAGLTGEAWLAFLDARGGHGAFREGAGGVLATLPYGGTDADPVDVDGLLRAVRRWLKANPA